MQSRGERCSFNVFTVAPSGNYVEIGAIDVQPGAYGSNAFTDLASFKAEIEPEVCRAGGDAAVAFANGYGMYIKATILKSAAASSAAPPPHSDTGGCRYDTQCKGDRVCQKGECVAP